MVVLKKIPVTGADGFIGSHLTEKLVKLGYKIALFIIIHLIIGVGLIVLIKI